MPPIWCPLTLLFLPFTLLLFLPFPSPPGSASAAIVIHLHFACVVLWYWSPFFCVVYFLPSSCVPIYLNRRFNGQFSPFVCRAAHGFDGDMFSPRDTITIITSYSGSWIQWQLTATKRRGGVAGRIGRGTVATCQSSWHRIGFLVGQFAESLVRFTLPHPTCNHAMLRTLIVDTNLCKFE